MRKWALLVCLLVLFSGEQAFAQRSGPGLFLGPGYCSDVTGQVTNQTYCMDYSSGALYVWNGSAWAPISGNGTISANVPAVISVANTSAAAGNTQAYFQAQSNAGYLFMGVRGTGYNLTDVPAGYTFVEASAGTNGLFLNSNGGDLRFAADNNISVGSLRLVEDAAGSFYWYLPTNTQTAMFFDHNLNASNQVIAANTDPGGNAQSGFFVENDTGIIGGFSAIGSGATGYGAPYHVNEPYLNGDNANGLLIYSAGALHLAASSVGWAGTLDLTEDGAGNFFFSNSNPAALTRFTGGNPVLQVISTTNVGADLAQFYAQNITQGIAIGWNYIREIGSCGNCSMVLDSQPGGELVLQDNGWFVGAYGPLVMRNNNHILAVGGPSPSLSSCPNGALNPASTDTAGSVSYPGGATGGSCTIAFGRAYGIAPAGCVCSSFNANTLAAQACGAQPSTTTLRMIVNGGLGTIITWSCIGSG